MENGHDIALVKNQAIVKVAKYVYYYIKLFSFENKGYL
jgi:hypothetical protein